LNNLTLLFPQFLIFGGTGALDEEACLFGGTGPLSGGGEYFGRTGPERLIGSGEESLGEPGGEETESSLKKSKQLLPKASEIGELFFLRAKDH